MTWNNEFCSWRYRGDYIYNPFGENLTSPQPPLKHQQQSRDERIESMFNRMIESFDRLDEILAPWKEARPEDVCNKEIEELSVVPVEAEDQTKVEISTSSVPISAEIRPISTKILQQRAGSRPEIPSISAEILEQEVESRPDITSISAEIPLQKKNLGLPCTNLGRDFIQSCPRSSKSCLEVSNLARDAPESWREVPREPPKVRLKLLPHLTSISFKYGVAHKVTIPYHLLLLGRARIFQQDMKRVFKKKFYGSYEKWLQGLDEQSKVFDVS